MSPAKSIFSSCLESVHWIPRWQPSIVDAIIQSTASRNRNGDRRHPWQTPDIMKKGSVKEPLWTTWQVDCSYVVQISLMFFSQDTNLMFFSQDTVMCE